MAPKKTAEQKAKDKEARALAKREVKKAEVTVLANEKVAGNQSQRRNASAPKAFKAPRTVPKGKPPETPKRTGGASVLDPSNFTPPPKTTSRAAADEPVTGAQQDSSVCRPLFSTPKSKGDAGDEDVQEVVPRIPNDEILVDEVETANLREFILNKIAADNIAAI